MSKYLKNININYLFYFLVILVAVIQFRSILTEKPFWIDEWFVLSSVKFRNSSDFWVGPLNRGQAFPRVYLFLIKYLSSFFDYNFLSIRIIPFIVQVSAFLLYFKLIKSYFKWPKAYVLLASFFVISLETSVVYFSQIKQYSMEIFMSAVALYQYYNFEKKKTLYYIPFFLGPFFSYTYPILISPLFINEFFKMIFCKDKYSYKYYNFYISSFLFLLAMIIFYFIDLQFVMYGVLKYYWSGYLVSYSSFKIFFNNILFSFYNFFTMIWPSFDSSIPFLSSYFLYIKIAISLVCLFGLVCIIFKKKDQTEKYIIILLIVILALYLAGSLPVGPNRLNCSFVIVPIYCFIFGCESIKNIFKNNFISRIVIYVFMYFVALVPLACGYAYELKYKNDLFSRSAYKNYGSAISKSYELNSDIYIAEAIAPPEQLMLVLKTHPNYKISSPKDIFIVKDIHDICVKKGASTYSVVFINASDDFKVISQKQCEEEESSLLE